MLDMRGCLENQDLTQALDIMGNRYLNLRESYTSRRIAKLRDVQLEVLQKHDEYQKNPDIPGLSFGFPFLDSVSGGAQNGDFIIIVGQTGVGKTYLALKVGYSSYLTGKNVIILSTEMPNLQAARRVLAMEGRFSTTDLKLGRLSYFGRERAEQIARTGAAVEDEKGNFFYLLPGGMFPKVEDFVIVVKELKPDFAIVDGAYLLQANAKSWWEKNMEIAMQLKNLALNEDIPILATYQYLKKGEGKLEGVGGGFAIPQIASMVLSFEFERKEDISSLNEVQHRVLRLTKGRDGESGSMRVEYNMKTTQLLQIKVLSGRVSEEDLIEPDMSAEHDPQDYADI
jgi:replicative DNA helicase